MENIRNCFNLRELYKKYKNLINSIYKEDTNSTEVKTKNDIEISRRIKNEINKYYIHDEFAFILKKNIKKFFEIKKDKLENSKIFDVVVKFNPYFNIKDKEIIEAVKILSELISINVLEENENNKYILEGEMSKLDDKIKSLIYNQLIKIYNDKKYEKMKQYVENY